VGGSENRSPDDPWERGVRRYKTYLRRENKAGSRSRGKTALDKTGMQVEAREMIHSYCTHGGKRLTVERRVGRKKSKKPTCQTPRQREDRGRGDFDTQTRRKNS